MSDVHTPRKWLKTPVQRGAFVLWLASSLVLAAFGTFPAPFTLEDEVHLEERLGRNARKEDQIAVPRHCLRSIEAARADQLERDFLIVEYRTNPYSWLIAEDLGKLFVPPETEYRFGRSELVTISSDLQRGPVCDTIGSNRARHCTGILTDSLFRQVVTECGVDAPIYWNKVGTRIDWRIWENLSNIDDEWTAGAGWVWLLSGLVMVFGSPAVRLWRWVRFG